MAVNYHKAHEVDKGDPKLNGPFLDDIRAEQERAYRERKKGPATKRLEKDEKRAKEQATVEDTSLRTDKGILRNQFQKDRGKNANKQSSE